MGMADGSAEATWCSPRIAAIDLARGLAVCGMVAFHLAWDLADWGWIRTSPAQSPAWMTLGHTVAATFLFVSGFCLVLAHPQGTRAALRRLAILAAGAGLVTAATFWIFPDAFIFFGILHCIVLTNLIGLGFLRVPAWLCVAGAGASAVGPLLAGWLPLGGPLGWCLGLAQSVPPTLDYRPLLPWLALVLAGIATARLLPRPPHVRVALPRLPLLSRMGRHSLAIYMLHQPILFGLFFLAAGLQPKIGSTAAEGFAPRCEQECVNAGAGEAGCVAGCACMAKTLDLSHRPSASLPSISAADLDSASGACLGAPPNSR